LDDTPKPNEEVPGAPPEEAKDKTIKNLHPESETQIGKTPKEQVKEKTELTQAKKDSQKKTGKTEAEKVKKEEDKKKDDFRYIVRIANTDIDGEKKLVRGLTNIRGIGMHMSALITEETGINKDIKIGNLTDSQIEKIKEALDGIEESAPNWMLNHRKDYKTGEDIHLIGSDIDMQLRDEINIMKKIRSYKGIRHERGLPVRGQRTRANNRSGLTLGVSKRREDRKK
jgi:small subunit ribosomal protein S13